MRRLSILAFVIVLLALVSCSSDEEEITEYYPHENNSSWTYKVTANWKEDVSFVQYRFNGITQHEQGFQLQVLERWIEVGGIWVMYEEYILADNEKVDVYFLLDDENPYHRLEFPLEVGKTWLAWDDSDDKFFTVVAVEDVKVPAGEFKDCFKVSYTSETDPEWFEYYWYGASVGLVKLYAGYPEGHPDAGDTTYELNSYNIF